MRITKIESCSKCHLIDRSIETKHPMCSEMWVSEIRNESDIHPDCQLEKYIDTEAIKDLCNQYIGSRHGLEREILAIINQ